MFTFPGSVALLQFTQPFISSRVNSNLILIFILLYLFSLHLQSNSFFFFFFLNDTAPPEISTLSLHDALPISVHAHEEGVEAARLGSDDAEDSGASGPAPLTATGRSTAWQ